MRRLPWTIVKLVIIALLLAWVAAVPGRVQIAWDAWRFESTPGALFVVLLLASLLLGLLYAVLHRVVFLPKTFIDWRRARRRNSGYRTLLEVIAEPSAERALGRAMEARRFLDEDALSTLIAAQTAEAAGQGKQAEVLYEALGAEESMRFVALLGLTRLARMGGDFAKARAYAERARGLQADAPRLLVEQVELARREGSSREALRLLDRLRRSGGEGFVSSFARYEARLHLEVMESLLRDGDKVGALRSAQFAYRSDSVSAILPYLERLAEGTASDRSRGVRIARTSWSSYRSRAFAEVCFRLWGADTLIAKARVFEDFVLRDPHVRTRLILAEVLLDTKLWARAKGVLEDCEAEVAGEGGEVGDRVLYYRLRARLAREAYSDDEGQRHWLGRIAEERGEEITTD